jgi:hypothetical protein
MCPASSVVLPAASWNKNPWDACRNCVGCWGMRFKWWFLNWRILTGCYWWPVSSRWMCHVCNSFVAVTIFLSALLSHSRIYNTVKCTSNLPKTHRLCLLLPYLCHTYNSFRNLQCMQFDALVPSVLQAEIYSSFWIQFLICANQNPPQLLQSLDFNLQKPQHGLIPPFCRITKWTFLSSPGSRTSVVRAVARKFLLFKGVLSRDGEYEFVGTLWHRLYLNNVTGRGPRPRRCGGAISAPCLTPFI